MVKNCHEKNKIEKIFTKGCAGNDKIELNKTKLVRTGQKLTSGMQNNRMKLNQQNLLKNSAR